MGAGTLASSGSTQPLQIHTFQGTPQAQNDGQNQLANTAMSYQPQVMGGGGAAY